MKIIFPRYRDVSEEETEEVNEHVKRIITKKKINIMKTINLTIRLAALKGELKGDNWVSVLVAHIIKKNSEFVEKTVQINVDEYDSFIKDYLFETIRKDLCVYIEIQMNSVTTAIMAANSQEDYYIHTLVDEY